MKQLIYRFLCLVMLGAILHPAKAQTDTLMLSLQECRTRALSTHEEMRKADNAVLQSTLQKKNAFASYLPSLDGSAMAVYMKDIEMGDTRILMHGLWMAGISLQQVLYAGGRIKAGNELAQIGIEVAKEQQRKTQQDVILEADQAYWSYVAVLQKVKMLRNYVTYIEALDQSVAHSIEAELATSADKMRVSAKLSEIRYNLQKAENGAELCRLMLCNVIGADFSQPIRPSDTVIAIDAPQSLTDDVSSLPEVELLELNVAAKKKQVKSTLGEYLPSLALMGGWNYMDNLKIKGIADYQGQRIPYTQTKGEGFWYGGVTLNVPIWNWGKSSRSVKHARLESQNAQLDLDRNTRLLTIRARQAVQNVISGYAMIQTAQQGLDQATENLRVMREKYDAAFCTLTDLLDAQSQWQQAESNLTEAQTQYKIYESEYQRAVGGLE